VTLHVEAGCNLGIIGPNGSGKTTLLKIMLGLLTDYAGSVTVMGHTPAEACRRGDVIGYVAQKQTFEPRFPVNVRQVVRMGLTGKTGLFRRHPRRDLDYVDDLLERAPARFGLGLRLCTWVVIWCPLFVIGRARRFHRLEQRKRIEVLDRMAASDRYLIREMPMLFKMVACLGYCGLPAVQQQIGIERAHETPPEWAAAESGS